MSSGNPLDWLRRAFDLVASGLWAALAGLLDALRNLGGAWAGLAVLALASLAFMAARLMQARLVSLLVADPRRTVRWRDLELWFSLAGLLWLPVHLVRKATAGLRAGFRQLKKQAAETPAPSALSQSPGNGPAAAAGQKATAEPLLVPTLGPSFLLGGVATVALYAVALLIEPLLSAQLGLAPGTPAWQYLALGGRPELGVYLPLQDAPFLAGLLAVLFWLLVGWWAARLVRLLYRHPLGGNRYADREDDSVLTSWRRWAGATFLARPAESYRSWATWPVLGAFPLLAWAWFSLASRPFRVEASEFAVAFVLWLFWSIHLSLRGFERLPVEDVKSPIQTEAQAAGWPEVLAWIMERHQVARPRELDVPREVEPLHLTDIPPEVDAVLSPLVLDLVPPSGRGRLTMMQRVILTDLSLLAYVHLDPPIDRDRLEMTGAAGEVLEDRSGLRKRHQVVIAPESAGKTTLALLAAANHVLVHARGVFVVARDEATETEISQRFRAAIEPTTLRWNVRIRRAGADLMNDLSQGIVPDVVVASLQRLAVDLLGNEGSFLRFLQTLGLIVVDDVESFAGPVEDHAQLTFRRLAARVCRLLGVHDLDERGAPQFLVLGTDSMDDLPAWARSLCGIDAVTRDFTRSRADAEEREAAERAARGIPVREGGTGAEEKSPQAYFERLRQGRHQVFFRLRDFRTASGEALRPGALVAACEQLAVPWHYRSCGDGRRRWGRAPLLLRDEPKHCVDTPEDACVVLLEGRWSDIRRERRRLRRAGARFSRYRVRNESTVETGAPGPEPIALVTIVDPDEEMAFTQLDQRFGLKEALDRLPYPVLRSPSGRVRQAHLAADLVQHWHEVEEVLDVFGPGAAHTLSRLSRTGVLLTDPYVDVAQDAPRYERKLQVRALARATPTPDAPPADVAAAPLPPQVGEVEVTAPTVVAVRDRIRSLVLARVDAAAAGFLYYPGCIFHDARGSYAVVGRTSPDEEKPLVGSAGDVEVEPLLADDVSSPRRRVRFQKPAAGPPAPAAAEDPEEPAEPAAGPDPLLIGDHPMTIALLPVELESEHVATYRLGPIQYEVRQRQVFDSTERGRVLGTGLSTWAVALYPNPEGAGSRGPALAFASARLIAAAMRAVLPSMFRGAAGGLEVALRIEQERPVPGHVLGPWEGFFLFDVEQGGNGTARALHRDKVEELLRLCRLLLERVLDPGRLLAFHDHWGDEEEILAVAPAGSGSGEGGGDRWQTPRRDALIWLDSRLRPEGRAEGGETAVALFAGGSQPGEGDLIDIGRCWYSRDGLISDLVWSKHRWRLPRRGEAMLDTGFDRETATGARLFTEEATTQAAYRAVYEGLRADPDLRLPDGTIWGMPREAWMPDKDGRNARSCRDGLGAAPLQEYGVLVWSMAAQGFGALEALAEMLRERSGAGSGGEEDRLALLSYLAHFVQGIPYSVPGALRSGLRPPVSTLLYRLGDCDSKSLLLALLAWHCGIPAGLFVSFQDGHALAAVAAPDPLTSAAPAADTAPESAAGAPDEGEAALSEPEAAGEPESPALAHLAAWSDRAGLPEPPCLWGELPVAPGETAMHLYVPVESTAYAPVGRARVATPLTWAFLPLVGMDRELSGGGTRTLLPSDRAEHEDR